MMESRALVRLSMICAPTGPQGRDAPGNITRGAVVTAHSTRLPSRDANGPSVPRRVENKLNEINDVLPLTLGRECLLRGMKRRCRRPGRTVGVPSVRRPSPGRGATSETRRKRSFGRHEVPQQP
jgi:hypothetical protein